MLRLVAFSILTLLILLFSCTSDSNEEIFFEEDNYLIDSDLANLIISEGGSLEDYILPDETDYNQIPQDPNNPLSRTKVELGKLLFHETALAQHSAFPESMNTYSCASCHHADAGFQANLPQGIGDGGIGFGQDGEGRIANPLCDDEDIDVQPIRTPSALNIAYQTNILWNGQFGGTSINLGTEANWTEGTPKAKNKLGFEGVETQAIAGLDVHRFGLSIEEDFIASTDYKELFDIAFGDVSEEERYSSLTAGLAIAAYERTLLANESPFQQWLKGDEDAMTYNQKAGALVFFKNNCNTCHDGPALSSMAFHAYGLDDLAGQNSAINVEYGDTENLGRGGFTGNAEDNYKFKVPQLYNLKDSPFLGHGSSMTSIREMIEYKNNGRSENDRVDPNQISEHFVPLNLSVQEISQLVEFISEGLYDPNLRRYNPSALPSGQCFPNNDALSKVDLGCI